MLFTSECFLSRFVEKYTLFTFVLFFKSKHDISLSIIKSQTTDKTLKDLIQIKKTLFIVMVITTGQEENNLRENSIQGRDVWYCLLL